MAQVFKPKPIDGNSIVKEIQARREKPGSSGFIQNRQTGERVSVNSDITPQDSTYNQEYSKIQTPEQPTPRDTSSDEDQMEADEGYRNFAQSYEYETGIVPSYEQYQNYMDSDDAQANMSEDDIEQSKQDYLNTMGNMSNFMESKGVNINQLIDMLPEDLDQEMDIQGLVDKIKDPRKIESEDDIISVGMAIDYFADFLNLDTEKFFTTGEAVECGQECQDKRNADKQKYQDEGTTAQSYEDKLAMLEEQQ